MSVRSALTLRHLLPFPPQLKISLLEGQAAEQAATARRRFQEQADTYKAESAMVRWGPAGTGCLSAKHVNGACTAKRRRCVS